MFSFIRNHRTVFQSGCDILYFLSYVQLIHFLYKIYHFIIKSENRRAEQVLPGGVGTNGRREDVGREIWRKYCAHKYETGKMRPVETVPGMGEGG
jgi:hypothetical protein